MNDDTRDLTRIVLSVLFALALIASSFWILRPFILATIWATTIVIATWPIMLKVEARLGKRRGLTVAAMVVVMLLAFVLPLGAAVESIVSHSDTIADWIKGLPEMTIPAAPAWVHGVPVVGEKIAKAWNDVAEAGTQAIFVKLTPYTKNAFTWLMSRAGGFGALVVQFLLTVAIAAILYSKGETAARGVLLFGRRLGGERGESVVRLAASSVRAVALGVVVTALTQTVLAGIGLAVAGVPFAAMLTGVILFLCIAQLGPLLVLIPAVIWLYTSGSHGWAIALFVWSVFVGTIDNFLRPILIKRGADLPLLLIFAGVIGGLLAFGVVGLFVGPVLLAVTYTLVSQWVLRDPATSA
jgi:predicted PurR-regulated permease PerM